VALLAVALVAGLGACGEDRPRAATEASDGAGSNPAPAAGGQAAVRVPYAEPRAARAVGSGVVEAVTLDGEALLVRQMDKRFLAPGCEGEPEPVLARLPLAGGERQVLEPSAGEALRGRLVRGPDRRVALVEACEGFLERLSVAEEAADGSLSRPTEVPLDREHDSLAPRFDTAVAWSPSGELLMAFTEPAPATSPGESAAVRIDVRTGRTKRLLVGRDVVQVAELSDGRLVSAGGGNVRIHRPDGATVAETAGEGFAISPNGRTVAVSGTTLVLLEPDGTRRPLVTPDKGRIVEVAWSPSGDAVAYAVTEGTSADTTRIAVVTVAEKAVTELTGPGRHYQLTFSPAGDLVAFSRFSDAPGSESEVLVVRFGDV
jgi:hypothetical protein